ncbi:hypothetical protein NE237_009124 [Protea cynaroides]|uniref:Uncharacterized protein n=1 Tax=Protea cynaroides TaxID=273540 RepID=A0A9Q0R0C2_9MAGN|nr:hypothetical protein NE237_009124 [Protea cynaroides]
MYLLESSPAKPIMPSLDKRVGHLEKANCGNGDIIARIEARPSHNIDDIHDRDHEQGQQEQRKARVDSDRGIGSVGEGNDDEEACQADKHVNHSESLIGAVIRVEIIEVIDGDDEGVPQETICRFSINNCSKI